MNRDKELFLALQAVIRTRIPDFRIKYKDQSKWQRLIGKLAFFNRQYMTHYVSTFGTKVFYPSQEFVEQSYSRAFKILAHEYVHLMDRKRGKFFFELAYALPQFLFLFSLLSLLAFFYSNWWLLCLTALAFASPIPSISRAALEMRGYGMNVAINVIKYGDINDETRKWLKEAFSGWSYYKMWPFEKTVDEWIDGYIRKTRAIDVLQSKDEDVLFSEGIAFLDVYSLITDIQRDE